MKSLSIVRFYNDNPKKNTQIFGAIDEKENVIKCIHDCLVYIIVWYF